MCAEVLELCELLQPTEDEAAGRNAAVAAVTEVVKSIWPNATVAIFGSFATGGSMGSKCSVFAGWFITSIQRVRLLDLGT